MSDITTKEPIEEQLLHFAEHLTRQNAILINAIIRIARLPSQNGTVLQKQIMDIFVETMVKIS